MTMLDWPHLVAAGVIGAAVLLLGLRGRRVDALPRCRRRRCRYDLTSFLGETRPGRAYPITCPECGRVAGGERAVRWGRRRARRWVVGIGALLLALTGAVAGVEVYTRTQSVNTITWLPLFMLLDRAPKDTQANAYAHQVELLRRTDAGEIDANGAARVVRRILAWQKDESVEWGYFGEVFAALAGQGLVPEIDLRAFWDGVWLVTVRIRTEVWEGDPIPFDVFARWRGHGAPGFHNFPRPIWFPSDPSMALPPAMAAMPFLSTLDCEHNGYEIAWWDRHTPPLTARGARRYSEFAGSYSTGRMPLVATAKAGQTEVVTLRGLIEFAPVFNPDMSHTGLRTQWSFDRTATIRIVPRGQIHSDPEAKKQIASALRTIRVVFNGGAIIGFPAPVPATPGQAGHSAWSHAPGGAAPATALSAHAWLRIGETETPLKPIEFDPAMPTFTLDLDRALSQQAGAATEPMYLVLRCNHYAVRHSPELVAWDGEIVLPVEVRQQNPVGSIPLLLPPGSAP